LTNLNSIISKDLPILQSWLISNKLSLNVSKTTYILFNKNNQTPTSSTFEIAINNTPIERSARACILGVTLDQNLSFKDHIINIQKKLSSSLYILTKIRDLISITTALSLYHSLFESHLNYCITIWGNTFTKYLHGLQVLQNKYLKKVLFLPQRTHSISLYQQLNLLPVHYMYKYHIALTLHKFMYNPSSLPPSILSLFNLINQTHTHRTRASTSLNLHSLSHSNQARNNSISVQAPIIWNSIPLNIKSITSFPLFKSKLNAHYLSSL
jgi:hypothetical protein